MRPSRFARNNDFLRASTVKDFNSMVLTWIKEIARKMSVVYVTAAVINIFPIGVHCANPIDDDMVFRNFPLMSPFRPVVICNASRKLENFAPALHQPYTLIISVKPFSGQGIYGFFSMIHVLFPFRSHICPYIKNFCEFFFWRFSLIVESESDVKIFKK